MADDAAGPREHHIAGEIYDLAPVAYLTIDCDENVQGANRTLLEWVGLQTNELLGRRWTEALLTVAGRVLTETHIRPLLRMQHAARGIALDLRCRDGRRLPVLATIVERRGKGRASRGHLLTFVEAIDREHYERALLDAKHEAEEAAERLRELAADLERRVAARTAELENANRELDSFAHAVSHDLRAPLRTMSGFSKVLADEYGSRLDPQGLKLLSAIDDASRNLSALIDGLLQLSLTSRGQMHLQMCDLSQLAAAIRDELVQQESERLVQWRIEPGLHAWADPRMMQAALRNLLGNAWKYTAKTRDALIVFDSIVSDGERVFRVSDNGAGFDMDSAHRLFEPFQRMHSPSEFAGLGIGLATVQRIVRRHGGTLSASAKRGQGATFSFTLPMRDVDPGL